MSSIAPLRWIRQLYDWVLSWGESRYGLPALFFLSMAEASFFPVPPDALLIALCMGKYRSWMKFGVWAVGVAGFTPIPYKVFTIAAGFFQMAFVPFLIASAISRSLRFFMVAGIIGLLYRKFGNRIQLFIDKYFNWLALAFTVLLILGFVAIGIMSKN